MRVERRQCEVHKRLEDVEIGCVFSPVISDDISYYIKIPNTDNGFNAVNLNTGRLMNITKDTGVTVYVDAKMVLN